MGCRHDILSVGLAAVFSLAISIPANAQGHKGGGARHAAAPPPRVPKPAKAPKTPAADHTPIDQFERMSPEERQKALAKLPPERAEKLQKQLKEYSQLTPEQQAAAREQLEMFRHLPPERQEALRKAFNKFSHAPADRQQSMRQELNQLRAMSPPDRRERMNAPEFKSRFNRNEQKMLSEMSNLLPER
ncbi:MAG: DUF3106 domain-containing protein [Bryobacteraceae bacterium]